MSVLPPLTALRAFEAAARLLSFKDAASDLNVTPGAISQHIKNLEDSLGMRLFRKEGRGLTLTAEGQAYFPAVRSAFRQLARATERLRPRPAKTILTVSCTRGFAVRWLIPRLGRFQERSPEIDMRICATDRIVDFARDGIDFAVRHGLGSHAGLVSERLLDDDMVPVCAPVLLRSGEPLPTPHDLRRYKLLHCELEDDWRMWLEAAGVDDIDSSHGTFFSDSGMAIEAAVAGQGVALARESFVAGELAEGRLVKLFPIKLRLDLAYYLVYPEEHLDRTWAADFRAWILAEAERPLDAISVGARSQLPRR